jgi:hypothetical protein
MAAADMSELHQPHIFLILRLMGSVPKLKMYVKLSHAHVFAVVAHNFYI